MITDQPCPQMAAACGRSQPREESHDESLARRILQHDQVEANASARGRELHCPKVYVELALPLLSSLLYIQGRAKNSVLNKHLKVSQHGFSEAHLISSATSGLLLLRDFACMLEALLAMLSAAL